jgi:hypothetical protein
MSGGVAQRRTAKASWVCSLLVAGLAAFFSRAHWKRNKQRPQTRPDQDCIAADSSRGPVRGEVSTSSLVPPHSHETG